MYWRILQISESLFGQAHFQINAMRWGNSNNCATYNFTPREHSRESPFILMFGRDPWMSLTEIFTPKIRYLGTNECILSLRASTEIHHMVAHNLQLAREWTNEKSSVKPQTLTVGDMVLLKSYEKKALGLMFKGHYRVIAMKGNEVQIIPQREGITKMST